MGVIDGKKREVLKMMYLLIGLNTDFFMNKWQGIAIRSFSSGYCITSIEAYGPDSMGNVYLRAITSSGDTSTIFRNRWFGVRVSSFISSSCINRITALSDTGGWITLYVHNQLGDSGAILSAKWQGIYMKSFDAGNCVISGFSARSDTGGLVILSADTSCGTTNVSENLNQFDVKLTVSQSELLLNLSIPYRDIVEIKIFSLDGKLYSHLRQVYSRGFYVRKFHLKSGIYIVKIRYKNNLILRKIIVPNVKGG